jgi:nicotinate phosphoribosyltransferase
MAHALILTIGTEEETFRAFHDVIDSKVHRVALVDTFNDEKFASLKAAETLGKDLFGVRLDTPKSRRGDFFKVLEEVRWELDLRGYDYVKIFLSGGIDENQIMEYNPFADAYGVGTAISNAPVVDFSFDLVEIEGKPMAKRGKLSGSKQVYRCKNCYTLRFLPEGKDPGECECGGPMEVLLQPLISGGKLKRSLPKPQAIRSYVLEELSHYSL